MYVEATEEKLVGSILDVNSDLCNFVIRPGNL